MAVQEKPDTKRELRAYCAQAVLAEAQLMAGVAQQPGKTSAAPFNLEELQSYLQINLADLRAKADYEDIAAGLERLTVETETMYHDLEELERRLTALEDKMIAIARSNQTDDQLLQARRELDQQLRPYRGKMTAEQLTMLEKQYLDRQLLETNGLPRLNLFYLR